MNNFDEILSETVYSTKETAKRMATRYSIEELSVMMNKTNVERNNLICKYYDTKMSSSDLMKRELHEYLTEIITLMNQDYDELIPADRLAKLNKMCESDSVIVINDETDKHDFSADSANGKVIVNLANLGKTKENPNPDIYTQMAFAKGTLPHELFHIVINMLKPEKLADERMIINLKDGQQITSRGMVGFMLNEGFVEKFSEEFCERNNLYYSVAPQYIPYIDICNYIMECNPQINKNTIFSVDASECINGLSLEDKEKYYKTETISYAVRHKNKNADEVKSSKIEKVNIDLSSISENEMKNLQEYYKCKNEKFAKTIQMENSTMHL